MNRRIHGRILPAAWVLLTLVPVTGVAQTLEHRRDAISGGAEAIGLAQRAADPSALSGSPAGGALGPVLFVPGVNFPAYNYENNAIETGSYLIPPDPIGAAGLDRVIAVVNVGIECRTKTGALVFRDALRDFFSPLGAQSLGTLTFDPKIVYDHYENRFVVVALERWSTAGGNPSNESRILVAVSKTSSPATTTAVDWWYMAINSKINISGNDYWADYPGFEVDEEAVYITANMFPFASGSFAVRLWIINKGVFAGFYAGGAPSWAVYNPIPVGYSALTTMPAQVYGAGGAGPVIGTYLVGYSSLTYGGPGAQEVVQVIRVDNPLGAATFTGQYVNVGDLENVGGIYGFPAIPDAPQFGTTSLIEVNDSRALDAVWRNNQLWITTTINPNPGNDPVNTGQATAHWFRLDTSAVPGPILVADQGNVGGEDIAGAASTFFPAVEVNANGDAVFGFSASASAIFCGAYYAGREPTDPPGTVQASGVVMAGMDFYLRTFGAGRNRWGDYSGASVDPSDGVTFWLFNEYAMTRGSGVAPEDGRWATAWASCQVLNPTDFGDAPDPTYPTLLASNGARHTIVGNVLMGALIDPESNGQPHPTALGDDIGGIADEDGVSFIAPLIPGFVAPVNVFVSVTGWLDAWFDFNQNGNWLDPGELVYSGIVMAGPNAIPVSVPMTALVGQTFARFRYNLGGPLPPTGPAANGEVEDYAVVIEEEEQLDFGDAPDQPYPTLLANNGARHTIVAGILMGTQIDGEADGLPSPSALGDDLLSLDDEDGVVFTTPLDPTRPAMVQVTVSVPGKLDAWIDFNGDGAWSPVEQIAVSVPVAAGPNAINFTVPGTGGPAFNTFARFRFSTGGALGPAGLAPDGEVEDYEVQILQDTVTGARDIPERFALHDAVPNPFNPQTTLSYSLPVACHVRIEIYDVRGQLVRTLVDSNRGPGEYRVTWNGRDQSDQPVASGVYYSRLEAGTYRETKSLVLVK